MPAAWTIFLGAFVLFLVQPLAGNTLLPAFGGTASVWTFSLAAFQALLVAGYLYAHAVSGRRFRPLLHLALVAASSAWLAAAAFFHPAALAGLSRLPQAPGAVLALAVLVALPYMVLSANSSLVQSLAGGRYRLYAVSNAGSIAGLLAYPLLFEPFLPLRAQWLALAALVALYGALLAPLSLRGRRASGPLPPPPGPSAANPPRGWLCFCLSFASCYLLDAVTARLSLAVTPLPLMWSALLSLYLLSYVLAFSERGSRTPRWLRLAVAALCAVAAFRQLLVGAAHYRWELATGASVLFLGGWCLHARLYRSRPPAGALTRYYLFIALGGAAGGAVCSFAMPYVSVTVAEYPVALALVAYALWADRDGRPPARAAVRWAARAAFAALAAAGVACGYATRGRALARYRNSYGVCTVLRRSVKLANGTSYPGNEFLCNGTTHGFQRVRGGRLVAEPMAYYVESAGGLAVERHPKRGREPMRVAVCGMGVGTMACYARPGDFYRFYEINPAVRSLAVDRRLFTFLSESSGRHDIVVDDARKALERERGRGEPKYDVIVVDVFNGDSIPVHMVTEEAFRLYRDRLEKGGVLAFHVTNWHFDLLPAVKALAAADGMRFIALDCRPTARTAGSRWVFVTEDADLSFFDARYHVEIPSGEIRDVPPLRDDFHSILPFIRF